MDIAEVLNLLHDNVDTLGVNPASGRYFGYIPGGGLFHAALGDYLAAITNRYAGLFFVSPFEVGPYPDLSIVTYRYLPKRGNADEFNQRLIQAIHRDGRIFVSSTRVENKLVLRAAIVSYRTHVDAVNEAIDVLASAAKQLEQE